MRLVRSCLKVFLGFFAELYPTTKSLPPLHSRLVGGDGTFKNSYIPYFCTLLIYTDFLKSTLIILPESEASTTSSTFSTIGDSAPTYSRQSALPESRS